MSSSIQFCGAARTVTGSRHVLRYGKTTVLIDCGLFQGPEELQAKNREPFPVDIGSIDAVIVTHAHTDHLGYLPRLIRDGYRGPVYTTFGTRALATISLPDGGRLQEEDARYLNKRRPADAPPVEPLFTERDAYHALRSFEPVRFRAWQALPGRATFRFLPAGHILGSAFAEIYFPDGERILMGGDLGRYDAPILVDPEPVDFAEYLVLESTYGDRLHARENVEDRLEALIVEAVREARVVLVPSFAIGRTQELLYHICRLQEERRIPRIPIFIDSPMASATTLLYLRQQEDFDEDMKRHFLEGVSPLEPEHLEFVRDRNQSKALNVRPGPMMIISGSGMLSGGRILHHLIQRLPRPETILLFTGFQARGTRGRQILDGAPSVSIYGIDVPVRAQVERLESLSAHADQDEIMRWLGHFGTPPRRTFLVHGEPEAQEALAERIRREKGWTVEIPDPMQVFSLADGAVSGS